MTTMESIINAGFKGGITAAIVILLIYLYKMIRQDFQKSTNESASNNERNENFRPKHTPPIDEDSRFTKETSSYKTVYEMPKIVARTISFSSHFACI